MTFINLDSGWPPTESSQIMLNSKDKSISYLNYRKISFPIEFLNANSKNQVLNWLTIINKSITTGKWKLRRIGRKDIKKMLIWKCFQISTILKRNKK